MRRATWALTLTIGFCAVAVYFVLPGLALKDGMYSVIGIGSVVCILAGTRRYRPVDRLAWYALAGSSACFVAGDAVADVYDLVLHREAPFPSAADALYLAGYPLLIVAISRLSRSTTPGGSRENRVDAAIVGIGAMALSWHLLMGSYAHDETLGSVGKLVTLAYPVMDIGVLFIAANALLFAAVRRSADALIGMGLLAMLIADFVYDVLVLHGSYATGNPVDAGWLISYVLLGAAALHPSMATAPGLPTKGSETASRLPLVALAGLVSPGILLVAALTHGTVDVAVLAGSSIVLFGLIVLRVMWLLIRLGQQASQLHDQAQSLQEALKSQLLLQEDLRHQAFHDSLTGLPNRALLHDRVRHALEASARVSGTVAVLFCDLDGFKAINDSLGHDVGDQLLVAASKRLLSAVRPGDTVARLGGDEFAILMEDVGDPAIGIAVAQRAVSVLRQPIYVAGQPISVSISIGVAFGEDGISTELLLSQADAAMYDAKARGKDRVQTFHTAMRTRIVQSMELRNSFPGALARDEFHLQYQPQMSLHDRTLEGFEALVRWSHPFHGEIEPADFIAMAEETGFIIPLGRWILETACETAATWPVRDGKRLSVSVNVSGRQLEDDHLVDDVRTALSYSGIQPQQLVLEITESVLIVNPDATAAVLNRLAGLGVRLAIDDFGTGYSSLNSLLRFPVDRLKIDKSFIDPLMDPGNEGSAFVNAIIRLAHDLRLFTVAEGIEHIDQQQTLVELGCDSVQGYLLSRPLDPDVAHAFATTFDHDASASGNAILVPAVRQIGSESPQASPETAATVAASDE